MASILAYILSQWWIYYLNWKGKLLKFISIQHFLRQRQLSPYYLHTQLSPYVCVKIYLSKQGKDATGNCLRTNHQWQRNFKQTILIMMGQQINYMTTYNKLKQTSKTFSKKKKNNNNNNSNPHVRWIHLEKLHLNKINEINILS